MTLELILTGIFNIIIGLVLLLVKIVLIPIDFLITQYIPSLATAFTAVGTYLTAIFTNMGWVLSITGIPAFAIGLVVAYWVFKLTLPVNVWAIKLAISWYQHLKP